jgi:predicted nucleic acid-binding Zn ribbon protein
MPLQPGFCDFCGHTAPVGKSYCDSKCRVAYNNLLARQGKVVMQMLKIWRRHRGAKGSPGAAMIGQIAARVDLALKEDRERWAEGRTP